MIVRAKEPFAYTDGAGVPRMVATGQLFAADDPCVVKRPNLFEPVEVAAARVTHTSTSTVGAEETASAAPGEVRQVRGRPRKTTSY